MIIINVEGNGSYWTQLPNGANNFQSTNRVHLELSVYTTLGQWFSLSTAVSSTNKTDRHDITEILVKVALSSINQCNQLKNTTYNQILQLVLHRV
jgi:hypothetical protein